MAASSCDASVSGRTPSLPRIGATVPSFCAISAWSRCSGSIAWWPRSLASDCAACSASCALTVSLSSLIAILLCAVGAPAPGSGRRRSANHCAPSHPMCRRSPCAGLGGSTVGESLRAVSSYVPSEPLRRAPGLDGRRIDARRLLSMGVPAGGIGPERAQALVEFFFGGRQLGRHHDPNGHQLVAGATALHAWHPVARQAERATARRRRRNLHRDLAAKR